MNYIKNNNNYFNNLIYYQSNGKLLITGEYVVLNGAKALAIPTKFGQKMLVYKLYSSNKNIIIWKAFNYQFKLWFFCIIDLKKMSILRSSNIIFSNQLLNIFQNIIKLNPYFLTQKQISYEINTFLEFPNTWGLGSSSTLISNLAHFTKVNPYKLLKTTFGGSGYDIACAKSNSPILFSNFNNKILIKKKIFNNKLLNNIYFVYLNGKVNSREAIFRYNKLKINYSLIKQISLISQNIIKTTSIKKFEILINEHENLLSNYLKIKKIKNLYFNDYKDGVIKSLGAWGGDFILITAKKNPRTYFLKKGFHIIFSFKEIIKNT